MTLAAPLRCSVLAEDLHEPMAGTVDQRTRWLLVEDRSAWGDRAVRDMLGVEFEDEAKARSLRPLLVRRREGPPDTDADRRAFLVDTVTGEMAVRTVQNARELSLDALVDGPVAAFGEPVAGPIFLVCTNGRRDACCALRGRAVLSALAVDHAEGIWECTHLGGHRFAGNLVCLPDGIVYGRVTPAVAPRLVSAFEAGRLDPELLRGRSAWPAPAQVAERELRLGLALDGLADVTLSSAEVDSESAVVILATPDGVAHRFELRAERLTPPRPISCRADDLEEPIHWHVVATT